jgi:NAD(P)-dependent dehydrogenase (short-subunit alcohol dehydrogenase family)
MSSEKLSGQHFEGKQAFVTGASKGLGEQIGLRLIERGVHVIGSSRSGPPDSYKQHIESGAADYKLGNIALEGSRIVQSVYEEQGGYEIFVNNAGAFSPDYFTRLDPETIERELTLDLVAPLLLHREWFGLYNEMYPNIRKPELSVNIASISSFYAWGGGTAYQAAKAGLSSAVAGLRAMTSHLNELKDDSIKKQLGPSSDLSPRFVSIYPDKIDTGLISHAQKNSLYKVSGDALPTEIVTDTVVKAIEGKGRFGEYDDIAILANPRSPGTTQELPGVYLAFIPTDEETGRPDFTKRMLEKIANENLLISRN